MPLNKKNFTLILFYLFIILSLISFIHTIIKSVQNGADFQWHPSKLLYQGINHYAYFLNGGKGFLSQFGEYGHGLYVILYPFTLLEWETAKILWLTLNIIFCFLIPILICKKFHLSFKKTIVIIGIFITCSQTRMGLNYGQQSLFTMFFLILPFIFRSKTSYFMSGFSYFKYSIGYILILTLLIKKKFNLLFYSILPSILGWFIYFIVTKSDPLTNLFEPLKLVLERNYNQSADLYSLLNKINFTGSYFKNKLLTVLIVLLFNCIIIFKINKIKSNLEQLALICLTVLCLTPHANYDYILLLPLLILSISNLSNNFYKMNFIIIIYYFYFNKYIKHLVNYDQVYQLGIFFILLICLFLNLFFKKNGEPDKI